MFLTTPKLQTNPFSIITVSEFDVSPSTLPGELISHDAKGKTLEGFTEQEWEKGASAKPAALLNVEKTPNTVNVFMGPKEINETILVGKSISKEVHSKGLCIL
ncbi:unnamed protein product [Angiostrongylus costaricensis]|uniref:Cation_ATPase_N domain-containing protein n=1 Tax=Angiostrongylus costaricensis TaxID=334426 RepID=A0A158PIU1_ANGCS|nr:unnamed protein product [Angiostrongylus costaricensis]